jgi:predicted Zn-dependent protease
MRRRSVGVLYSLAALIAGTAAAQAPPGKAGGGLVPPQEVVLYIHSELRSTAFVDPLICALERALVAPVTAKKLDLPLGPDLLASPTQFDVGKVADRFIRATTAEGGPRTFKYLLLADDLKGEPYRYVFATSFGNQATAYHLGVVSTARLDVSDPRLPHTAGADLTALRVYKIVLKSIARVAGYHDAEGCILAFPNNLDELDQKSPQFCAADRTALVAAGILKAKESGGCAAVAEAGPADELIAARD